MCSNRTPLFIILIFLGYYLNLTAQLTPQDAVKQMGRGINLGNTLEPPQEGGWNNGPAQEYYFDDYKSAGFKCVRVPVRWDQHTSNTAPYKIDDAWMNRVEQVVDWGLSRKLFIIINAHHEEWIKSNYSAANKARFDSIWSQISVRFKDKSDSLLFEIINEPKGLTMAQVDDLNARVLPIIRKTNPTRIVIYSGNQWSNLSEMMGAAIPNDDYVMAYYHSYDPWTFGGEGTGTYGSKEANDTKARFLTAGNWSKQNNIPVIISEFGAVHSADYNSRMLFYGTFVEESIRNNIAFQAWDDGGDFVIYDRSARKWPEVKDILIHSAPAGPTNLKVQMEGDSSVFLSWQNRTVTSDKIIVERKMNNEDFKQVGELLRVQFEYHDKDIIAGNKYTYRIIYSYANADDIYSYPIRIELPNSPDSRTPFLGAPFIIPGQIEAENFDDGGEGLTYHDTEPTNIPGDYRPFDGVDIEARKSDGGYQIAYIEADEWLEYTIDVSKTGSYKITLETASEQSGGKLHFEVGDNHSPDVSIPSTGSWETTTTVSTTMNLNKGEQYLRLYFNTTKPFNVDRFSIEEATTDINDQGKILIDKFELEQNYPNPFNPTTNISFTIPKSASVKLEIFNSLGEKVSELVNRDMSAGFHSLTFNGENESSGIYYYKITAGKFTSTKKMMLLK